MTASQIQPSAQLRQANDGAASGNKKHFDIPTLREFLRYEPETGSLFWLPRDRKWFASDNHWSGWNKKHAGRQVTGTKNSGYLVCHIFRRPFQGHRVVWALVHGEWPDEIDHIDGNPSNNRLENLRNVSRIENCRNRRIPTHNTSGHIGIEHLPKRGTTPERLRVTVGRKLLGRYYSLEEALSARVKYAENLGFYPNHGRRA